MERQVPVMRQKSVLFVCLGNICRSPMAEAVFIDLATKRGVREKLEIDSCGTGGWHAGEGADRRTVAVCRRRGVPISHVARQVEAADFRTYDLIVAMDRSNMANLRAVGCPDDKLRLMMEFARRDGADAGAASEVPDPYYDRDEMFDRVFDMLVPACEGLLAEMEGK